MSDLQILESLPPIHPFAHPDLRDPGPDVRSSQPEYISDAILPSERQVRQWQEERNALEEEVLSFDGGDLGRMKEKTRSVHYPQPFPSARADIQLRRGYHSPPVQISSCLSPSPSSSS